jgi:hypothetical protein
MRPAAPSPLIGAPAPSARPARPTAPPPPAATESGRPAAPPSAGPQRPAAPPSAGPERPATPTLEPASQGVAEEYTEPQSADVQASDYQAIEYQQEDDVMLAVPAAPPESLAQIEHPVHHRPRLPTIKSLSGRRTIIPICLTMGTFLTLFALLILFVGEESLVHLKRGNDTHGMPLWMPISIFVVAGIFLAAGVLTMFHVRATLAESAEQQR